MYIENTNDHLGKVKSIIERIKFEEVDLDEKRAETPAEWEKRTGKKPTKYTGPDKKDVEQKKTAFLKAFQKTKEKEKPKKSKPSRRYVQKSSRKTREVPYREKPAEIAQHYKLPDYIVHDDIKKFPKILIDGINKMIPERYGKFMKYVIVHRTFGKIPGLGVILPGDSIPKLMIQWNQRIHDPKIDYIWADPEYAEKGTDPSTYRKNDMIVWINEAATNNPALKGKVDWYQRKEFEGATPDVAAKRTLQYLKTKIKRMAKEEAELEVVVEREMTAAEKDKREEIVLSLKKKTKDFKERYGDKWKEVMYATATKMAMGESEEEPKSKKKDKINLKPKMDETMKTYKDLIKGLKESNPKPQTEEAPIKEGVTEQGVEYGEQDWDTPHRLDNIVSPPLGTTYKEIIDEDLEGPYLWKGEPYFFDRKIGSWYSVTSEDYVDDVLNKELSLNYTKAGLYKPQFGN